MTFRQDDFDNRSHNRMAQSDYSHRGSEGGGYRQRGRPYDPDEYAHSRREGREGWPIDDRGERGYSGHEDRGESYMGNRGSGHPRYRDEQVRERDDYMFGGEDMSQTGSPWWRTQQRFPRTGGRSAGELYRGREGRSGGDMYGYGQWRGEDEGHRGRGPKGYRRSDERIREDVNDSLTEDSSIDASNIEVKVENGEITLSGTVSDRRSRRAAEDLAEAISGVSHVQNNLRVKRDEQTATPNSSSGARQTQRS